MARPIQCLNCGKRSHLSKNCWIKLRNKEKAEKAHMAQSEEDELALFMVSASVLSDISSFDSKSTEVEVIDDGVTAPMVSVELELQLGIAKAPAREPIQLKEARVFVQISERDE